MHDHHHTKIIFSSIVDWIQSITLKKHNPQLFSATERVLNNIVKNDIIVGNVTGSIFATSYYSDVYCGCKWMTHF
jgi:hypothetical protein